MIVGLGIKRVKVSVCLDVKQSINFYECHYCLILYQKRNHWVINAFSIKVVGKVLIFLVISSCSRIFQRVNGFA